MILKVGQSLASAVDATTLVVLRPVEGDVTLLCGGVPMVEGKVASGDGSSIDPAHVGGAVMGKRYVDEASGLEVLCTKPGLGRLALGESVLAVKGATPLPSSDLMSRPPNEEWSDG